MKLNKMVDCYCNTLLSWLSVGCLHFRFFFLHLNEYRFDVHLPTKTHKFPNKWQHRRRKKVQHNKNHMVITVFVCVISLVAVWSLSFSLCLCVSLDYIIRREQVFCVPHTQIPNLSVSRLQKFGLQYFRRKAYVEWKLRTEISNFLRHIKTAKESEWDGEKGMKNELNLNKWYDCWRRDNM